MKGCQLIFYDKGFEERNKEKKDFKCKYFFLVMSQDVEKREFSQCNKNFFFFF
jgi:hypothetical protein